MVNETIFSVQTRRILFATSDIYFTEYNQRDMCTYVSICLVHIGYTYVTYYSNNYLMPTHSL